MRILAYNQQYTFIFVSNGVRHFAAVQPDQWRFMIEAAQCQLTEKPVTNRWKSEKNDTHSQSVIIHDCLSDSKRVRCSADLVVCDAAFDAVLVC